MSQDKSISQNNTEIQPLVGTEALDGLAPEEGFAANDALVGEGLYHALSIEEFLDLVKLVLFKGEANWSPRDRRRHREIRAKVFATNECFRDLRSLFEQSEDEVEPQP